MPSELFGQTFTIHKKVSDFGEGSQVKPKKTKNKKGHSNSLHIKKKEKHSTSKDLKLSKNLKTITMRKEDEVVTRKVSQKNILHKSRQNKEK